MVQSIRFVGLPTPALDAIPARVRNRNVPEIDLDRGAVSGGVA